MNTFRSLFASISILAILATVTFVDLGYASPVPTALQNPGNLSIDHRHRLDARGPEDSVLLGFGYAKKERAWVKDKLYECSIDRLELPSQDHKKADGDLLLVPIPDLPEHNVDNLWICLVYTERKIWKKNQPTMTYLETQPPQYEPPPPYSAHSSARNTRGIFNISKKKQKQKEEPITFSVQRSNLLVMRIPEGHIGSLSLVSACAPPDAAVSFILNPKYGIENGARWDDWKIRPRLPKGLVEKQIALFKPL